jgi:hypothetical protein
LKTKIFYSTLKNAIAFCNARVVAVNSKVVGLAPEQLVHTESDEPKYISVFDSSLTEMLKNF